jgi:hypothetical protein
MSFGLRDKKYHIKNKPYSKEEYEKILKSYALDTWSGVSRAKEEFAEYIKLFPHRFAVIRNSVNCTGDAIFNSKNTRDSFTARACEDVRFFESGNEVKNSYDLCTGGESELCYEGLTADIEHRTRFTVFSWKSTDVTYCQDCHSCEDLFGCASLKNRARYCILNKQYTKEEYFQLKDKLIAHMTKTGEWGEFFPIRHSNFGYNETMAQLYYPLTKNKALENGYRWQEKLQLTTGKETVSLSSLPDSIDDVEDSIGNEILSCEECSRNYRFVPEELKFYRRMSIPLPRKCFYCRNKERLGIRHEYKLYHRACQCAGAKSENSVYKNTASHQHHGANHCPNKFETSYATEKPEIVYCEECYQAEMI